MRNHNHHLTDQELVSAVDHELPARRYRDAESHLSSCARCRTRLAEIDRAAAHVTAAYHGELMPQVIGVDERRERLRLELDTMAREWDASWRLSLLSRVMRTPRWLRVSTAVIATILLARSIPSVQPQEIPVSLVERDALPVGALTPGAVWNVSVEDLCDGRRREQRQIPDAIREEVLRVYHMQEVSSTEYELDFLITPELGGAADARNLWPQRYGSHVWNALVKDQLEHRLPQLVCTREMDLATAQRELAGDWVAAYQKHFRTSLPIQTHASLTRDRRIEALDGDDLSYPVWRTGTAAAVTLISFSPAR